ncbi:MAG: outer membrane beta-barrel protein [Reyranella sp.]|uniref:outer membrane beta-barrel protein n=1 Tax=Reyranella sp. TaxID=1929291 RepID=UPI001AC20B8A|nr:outer membrane beta-barrel protein [Reyranella sp.]MBN9088886.1 outer membrane beta-barrel protein [Reyranella sp.]
MRNDKRFGVERVLGAAALAVVVGGGVAQAQTPGAVGSPGVREERPGSQTAPARAAENYDAQGVPIGSFRLFPDLELNEVYNDNIYATANGTSGRTASFIQVVKPTLDLRSDWNNHMLNLFAKGAFGFYSASSTENYQDFGVGLDGRFDIQRDWNVYGGGSFNRRHEDRGTPNVTTSLFSPTIYNQLVGNVGYYQRFNRLNVRIDGRLDNYTYFNNGLGTAQGVIQNSDRNRNEFRESARFGYEFSPGYQVWVRGSLNQRSYMTIPDSTGFNRNSSGWDLVGGVTVDLGGITSLEAFGGYIQQNYVDGRLSQISAPMFGLTGYWNPLRELMIRPFVRRTVEDSALTTAVSYVNTAFGADVTYNVRPNITLDAHGDYAIADYGSFPGVTQQRNEQYLTLRAGVLYRPTANFYVGPTYQYLHRSSNLPLNDYDQNMVMLRLGARL